MYNVAPPYPASISVVCALVVVYVTIHVPTLHAGSIKNGLKSPQSRRRVLPRQSRPRRSSAGIRLLSEGRGELTLTPLRGVTALRSDSPGRSRSPSPLRESPASRSPPLLLSPPSSGCGPAL